MTRLLALFLCLALSLAGKAQDVRVLFLGDEGSHQPQRRFEELQPVLAERGIELVYTNQLERLSLEELEKYDALAVYANIDALDDEYARAILDYVQQGGGFVPIHCASFCFRNQPELVELIGAQFQRHGTGVFQAEVTSAEHPVTSGFGGFRTWDETYVHHLHEEEGRTVLMYRVDESGREPWTWVKTFGDGRVFYTASGHDSRTWTNPGFHNLIERGIRWATGGDPALAGEYTAERVFAAPSMKSIPSAAAEFGYVDVGPKIPNYTPSRQWGTQGAPKTLMQEPMTPEDSMEHIVTPAGFDIERYADERDFESKPIAMTWDERGRLWLCETLDYPNELGRDRDRIRICEDTDGDSVADKFTVFAEGLSIPTAIVIVRGGAVVQNGTETIFLRDTNGDDVADERSTLISNWRLGDTHGGVSNFRYGLDNWIWAMQGYNDSRPEFQGSDPQSFRQGFWRFKLSEDEPVRVTDLEFIRSSDNNTWGLGISEEGLIFGSTANHNPSMFMTIPNRYYERVRGWAPGTLHSIADTHQFKPITGKVRQVDHHGGYTAAAGHALYTARAFPKQWWNQTAFVCGPTGHLIGTFVLYKDGANFESASPTNLLASDDEWCAPIMAEVGPDGAVWVLDWYNYIVQHNPTPNGFETGKGAAYESDLRDKRRGRIYRVVPEERKQLHLVTDLHAADNAALVETLRHPSMRWRLQAQRLLVERKAGAQASVVEALEALVADESVDSIGLNVGAMHALHTLAAFSKLSESTLEHGLQHPSAGVRRNALAVLPQAAQAQARLLQHFELFSDTDTQVRLQAVLTLSDLGQSNEAGELVAGLIEDEQDPVMLEALTSAAAAHSVPFLQAAAAQPATPALKSILQRVAEHVGRGSPDAGAIESVLAGVATAKREIAISILDGLVAGLPRETVYDNEELDASFAKAFDGVEPVVQVKLLRLATRVNSEALLSRAERIISGITETVLDEDVAEDTRLDAAKDLIGFRGRDGEVVSKLLGAITPQQSPEFATGILSVIQGSQAVDAGSKIMSAAAKFSPAVKKSALDVVLSKPGWAVSLLEAVEAGEFDLDELALDQKQSLRNLPNETARGRAEALLAKGGGLPDANREKVLQSLMHITKTSGDSDAGKPVFVKACANCHQYGNLGQKVGPNLTGMAVHPKQELLTHIIDPSRSVEGNYRMYNVLTLDGVIFRGMLAGETRTSVTIVDAQAKKTDIPREDIELLSVSRKSVMPEGFEQQLTEKELTDLLEFLTDTGPYVPVPLEEYATAISTKGLFSNGDEGPDRMVFKDWEPKTFKGVPFILTDPQGKSRPNIILLNGPFGPLPPKMPKQVSLPLGASASAIHLLSGVGGWSYPYSRGRTVSMVVRLTYEDGEIEEHELVNGIHFADYIRRVDVAESEFAFALSGQQIRYLAVRPERDAKIDTVSFVKGGDNSAPIIMAVTFEKNAAE